MRWWVVILAGSNIAISPCLCSGEPVLLYFGAGNRFVCEIIEEATGADLIRFQLPSGTEMSLPLSSVTRRYSGEFLDDYMRAERMAQEREWLAAVETYREAAKKSPDPHFADEVRRKAREQLIAGIPRLHDFEDCADVERVIRLADPGDVETSSRVLSAAHAWYRSHFSQWMAAANQAELRDDYRAAIRYYSKGVDCATDYPEMRSEFLEGLGRNHTKVAFRLSRSGKDDTHDAVVEHIEAAIKAWPEYQQAHLLKADVFCTKGQKLLDRREERIRAKDAAAAAALLTEASHALDQASTAMSALDELGGIPLGTWNLLQARVQELRNRIAARREDMIHPKPRPEDIPPPSFRGRVRFYSGRGWRSLVGLVFEREFWGGVFGWIGSHWMLVFIGFPLPIAGTIYLNRHVGEKGVLKNRALTLARVGNILYCIVLLLIALGLRSFAGLILFVAACGAPWGAYLLSIRFFYHPTGVCPSCGTQLMDYEDYDGLDFSHCPQCQAPLENPLTLLGYIEHVAQTIALGPGVTQRERKWDSEATTYQRDRMALLIRLLVTHALRRRATDIHIELDRMAKEKRDMVLRCRTRLRVDGVLFYETDFPDSIHEQLISAIKGMADMDIADRLHPQDGHFHMTIEGIDINIRASSSPTSTGQKMVLRLLDKRQVMRPTSELGFHPLALIEFENAIHAPHGVILATGPSGSGKTTLLYSALCTLLDGEKSVVSIEDPIEYDIPGINQIQHDPKVGVTFSNALRNILRQDPDVIMVGEVRDSETAKMMVEAAKTGHLVFSTLHTTDACTAASRLIDLGVSPQDSASALRAIVAQRLVRVICPHCKTEAKLTPQHRQFLAEKLNEGEFVAWEGKGCELCRNTGYLGRTGLFELLVVSEGVGELIARGASLSELRRAAQAAGMKTLWEDGLLKVEDGITTLDEVLRVARRAGEEAGVQ